MGLICDRSKKKKSSQTQGATEAFSSQLSTNISGSFCQMRPDPTASLASAAPLPRESAGDPSPSKSKIGGFPCNELSTFGFPPGLLISLIYFVGLVILCYFWCFVPGPWRLSGILCKFIRT